MVSIIASIDGNNAIGVNNELLCRLPNDMRRFRRLTTGNTVIMGRKTFESLPHGALPNRTNVVITRNTEVLFEGCETFNQLQMAISRHQHEKEIFIIGGATVYEQTIGFAERLYITCIHHSFAHADIFFPEINENDWVMTECESHPSDEFHLFPYTFKTFVRKKI